jgi:hypothetical protein
MPYCIKVTKIDPEKRKRLIRQWEHAKEDMSLRAFAMAHGMAADTFKRLIELEKQSHDS